MKALQPRPAGNNGITPIRAVPSDDADLDDDPATPRRSRLRLDTIERVRRELVKLYRQGRDGERAVADCSKLANILHIVGRLIEGDEIEKKVTSLEELILASIKQ